MFNVMVSFSSSQWQFMFKGRSGADSIVTALAQLDPDSPIMMTIEDDFGSHAVINTREIHGVIVEDMGKTGEAAIERSMVHARNQARFQSKASSDTMIKMSMPLTPPNGQFMRS